MIIDKTTINNTPVLHTRSNLPDAARILGAVRLQDGSLIYPAYLPFLPKVLSDIAIVDPNHTMTPEAQAYLDSVAPYPVWRERIASLPFPTKSLDHQLDGTAELLTYHRWFLRWGMGVGKTKITLDAIRILKTPTLVLCPTVAVANWLLETQKHGGDLRAIAIDATSVKGKLKQLNKARDYDLVVASYDTARLYGMPHFPAGADKLLENVRRTMSPDLRKAFLQFNNPTEQTRLLKEWLAGRSPKEIIEESNQLRGAAPQWLWDWNYHTLVCDESHRIKRIQSDRTGVILKMSSRASRRVLLSGTPIQGNPKDAFPQLKFLAPYILPWDWRNFCKNFTITNPRNDKIVVGYQNLHILNRIINSVGSARELDECVALPGQTFVPFVYRLSPEQVTAYDEAVREWVLYREDTDTELEIANAAIRVAKLLQICSGFVYLRQDCEECDTCPQLNTCITEGIVAGSSRCMKRDTIENPGERIVQRFKSNPKIEALSELLEDIVPNAKVIVWATYTAELDDVEAMLKKEKYGYVRVDGSTMKNVVRLAEQFNTDPECNVYLAQISTGISITLNAARYAVYYSRNWSLDDRKQSAARNYRIGQKEKVVVYDLVAERTVEEQQLLALERKEDISLLLTKKVDCVTCSRYGFCVKNDITPWDSKCVFRKTAERVIATATPLEDAED